MTPADDVAKIAEGLSEAQREAVLRHMQGYFDPNTIKALRRRGIIERAALTESGLAIKAYLESKEQGRG